MASINTNKPKTALRKAEKLVDSMLFAERSCMLDLSKSLHEKSLSYPQFFLLTYLANEEYLTMSNIAKKMNHTTAATTGLIDRLEKFAYVKRFNAIEDRRKICVHITNKGKRAVNELKKEVVNNLANLLSE